MESRTDDQAEPPGGGHDSGYLPEVFISYRRADAGYAAGWLCEELARRFGADRVFKDVNSIEPGDDFDQATRAALGSCSALLAVIGTGWLTAAEQDGRRRLDDPEDFVRREIEAALDRGVTVVPVLVGGAQMPRPEQLPSSLEKLAARQAVELRAGRFSTDLMPLLEVLGKSVAHGSPGPLQPGSDAGRAEPRVVMRWMPDAEEPRHFTGRAYQLAQLDRWAADPQVALIGVSKWGGAGKTALVTHWIQQTGGATRRPGVQGVFGWSFYADPDAGHWANALQEWAQQELGFRVTGAARAAASVRQLLWTVPLVLVLDGLEALQEFPAGTRPGELLDGVLREVLTGVCLLRHCPGLVILTSRVPFADLEMFEGGTARMLDVPPFTPDEGAALLASTGGDWLGQEARRTLAEEVHGHALAVSVLAGALADRPPAADVAALCGELAAMVRTSARVGRVLEFYADRLREPDRYLLAAISLFTRPVQAETIVALAGHSALAGRLTGWTPATVHDAVRNRLAGLASCHPDGSVSAHPLIRDAFRPLALGAAQAAVEATLGGLPKGRVTSVPEALRAVEAIELLLDAGHWEDASNVFSSRCDAGNVFRALPAARLGQRAAGAFVSTPARRDAWIARSGCIELHDYLNRAGLFAMYAGDLATAREYLGLIASDSWLASPDPLLNLAHCLGELGELDSARAAASRALAHVRNQGYGPGSEYEIQACAFLGWLDGLSGDTREAEKQFSAADQMMHALGSGQFWSSPAKGRWLLKHFHLSSLPGILWAEWLARTGRPDPALAWITKIRAHETVAGHTENVARCARQGGRIALTMGRTTEAGRLLAAAARCFRDGDHLTDLAVTLVDQAEHARRIEDPGAAETYAAEALTLAAPRKLIPAQSAALSARARALADRAATDHNPDHLAQGRDDADAALRLAASHQLAWHQLDALQAHAALDGAEHADQKWAAEADALRSRLIPPDLDPDPLATSERQAAASRRQLRRMGSRRS